MRNLHISIAAAFFSLLTGMAPAAAEMSPEQRQDVEAVVRDYLLAHPELIEEAMAELQKRKQQEAAAAQGKAIQESGERIFNSDHQMVLGNPEGAIALVEFFDYNCGYCKRAVSDMTALIAANPDLKVVMKEYPILSQGSLDAARVSVAVKDAAPQRYLDFHQELFARPGEVTGAKALEVARDVGLDAEKLKAAAADEAVLANLREVQELASQLGINGTPGYVIGNEIIPGAVGFDTLQEKVAAMRECGETAC